MKKTILATLITLATLTGAFAQGTFFSDTFSGSSLSASWTSAFPANVSVTGGSVTLTGGISDRVDITTAEAFTTDSTNDVTFIANGNLSHSNNSSNWIGFDDTAYSMFRTNWDSYIAPSEHIIITTYGDSGVWNDYDTGIVSGATPHEFKQVWHTSGYMDYYIDGVNVYTSPTTFSGSHVFSMMIYDGIDMTFSSFSVSGGVIGGGGGGIVTSSSTMETWLASSTNNIQDTTGFNMGGVVAWAGENLIKLVVGMGILMLQTLLPWVIVLSMLGGIIFIAYRAFRFYKH